MTCSPSRTPLRFFACLLVSRCASRGFRNAWYGYAKDRRVALVSEPLAKSAQDTELTHRWSAFCAATVEFLCERYDVPCPQWVHDPCYTLETLWWYTERADDPKTRQRLMQTTPSAFARRKIFC